MSGRVLQQAMEMVWLVVGMEVWDSVFRKHLEKHHLVVGVFGLSSIQSLLNSTDRMDEECVQVVGVKQETARRVLLEEVEGQNSGWKHNEQEQLSCLRNRVFAPPRNAWCREVVLLLR